MTTPPALPPRSQAARAPSPPSPLSSPRSPKDGLPIASLLGAGYSTNLDASDPRTSSSQSLIGPAREADVRRSLLVIYIHGFYGNDQSFRSFPAHVHALLTELLSDTHIVHSKIYPRYKTYRAIHVARDNFSTWLQPHESSTTDVILVGHSMGGLLAAEVVLLPNRKPHLQQPFKHRILGILSLDSPFLGLHPGIVVSGLSSLFQPASKPEKEATGSESQSSLGADKSTSDLKPPVPATTSRASAASPPTQANELYDPPYFNDVPFREKPFLSRLRHFASKHKAEGIFNALGNHIVSHLEFGGCMADYPELSARYKQVRALEDVDELRAVSEGHPAAAHRRVRFVNYYTLSPGRPKPSLVNESAAVTTSPDSDKSEAGVYETGERRTEMSTDPSVEAGAVLHTDQEVVLVISDEEDLYSAGEPRSKSDTKEAAENLGKDNDESDSGSPQDESRHRSISHQDPVPISEEEYAGLAACSTADAPSDVEAWADLDLAPIPPEPQEPEFPDLARYTDKGARKQAEREARRAAKAHQQAIKDRNKAIREREKLLEKRRKKAAKEAQQQQQQQKRHHDEAALVPAAAAHATAEPAAPTTSGEPPPRKLRKFCALPSGVKRDPTWVDVYMADVDEVGAHCGLFVPGAHYDGLVGDVGSRVVSWVHEDMSTRAAMKM